MKLSAGKTLTRRAVKYVVAATAVVASLHGAAQQKRIYIAPDDHTDYVWTADEKTYEKAMVNMTSYYLDLMDQTQGNPSNTQARWNFDGSLWMRAWENNKDATQIQRVVDRLRDGHLSMPLNYAVSTYGGMPTEAVLRGMYYSGEVERKYHLRFPMADAMEDQTIPRGLGALFAGSGAKYSWRGVCACATKMKPAITSIRPSEMYWWKGPDNSRVLMKWYSTYREGPQIGTYLEARQTATVVNFVDHDPIFRKAHPYDVIGLFGEGGDDLQTSNSGFVDAAKLLTTATRKVIVSNEEDFFRDFEKTYGNKLPEVTTGYGNEWDTYSASMAELSATVRRATERLRPAEAIATLVSLKQPDFYSSRLQARRDAWEGLGLYWEHDWTADSRMLSRDIRRDWQRRTALKVTSYVDKLLADGVTALGSLITRQGSAPRYFVFNPLNWQRDDAADLDYKGSEDIHVVDLASGATVPSQFVELINEKGTRTRRLRIWARGIPSVGYKTFEVLPGKSPAAAGGVQASVDALENSAYRVKVGPTGEVESIVAKHLEGRELVSTINARAANAWGLGTGVEGDWQTGSGTIEIKNAGPVSATLRVTIQQPLPRVVEVTLFREGDRIDIRNEVLGNFKETHTWGFSFALKSPDVHHEEIGAINHARVAPEGDYAATYSRLDWLTLNHFAAMSGEGGNGITLSNWDAAFMKLGHSDIQGGISNLDTITPQITVLAGGQVDGATLGIVDQGGDKYLLQRFAMQAYRKYDAASSMRFALEHQNPLIAGAITGGRAYPEKQFSLLSTTDPNLLLWAVKPSEEGIEKGVAVRLWNISDKPSSFSVTMDGGISRAWDVTHLETETGPAAVASAALQGKAAQWQMRSFRVLPAHHGGAE